MSSALFPNITLSDPIASESSLTNMSSASFPNTALLFDFPYTIPYNQTQECDIYGLACQTGSITVGVNLITTTTTTVVPCSSYLTAQSKYLVGAVGGQDDYLHMTWDADGQLDFVRTWASNFGRSPECSSFARAYSESLYTFSDCGSSNTVLSTQKFWAASDSFGYPPQIPPGLLRWYDETYTDTCCGTCTLDVSELMLYYFPDGNSTDCQYNRMSNSTSASTGGNLRRRMQSLIPNRSTAVVGEHTLYVA